MGMEKRGHAPVPSHKTRRGSGMTRHTYALTIAASASMAGAALGAIVPFTEDFTTDAANWRNASGVSALNWVAAGGPDGGSYASGTFNFQANLAGDTPVLHRGQDGFGSSGGAFFGNWIADGVTQVTVAVRQDSGVPLTFFGRFATSPFPGAVAINFAPVPSGVWTTLSFAINPASPQFISFEGSDFTTVFGNIGRVQFGVSVPQSLAGVNQNFTFDIDKITIVPAPGGLAVLALAAAGARRRRVKR